MLRGVPEHCCQSPLWEKAVRDNVTQHKISEQVTRLMLADTRTRGGRRVLTGRFLLPGAEPYEE